MIVQSLKDNGAARSIVIDEQGVVLAGNGVVDAAAEAGIAGKPSPASEPRKSARPSMCNRNRWTCGGDNSCTHRWRWTAALCQQLRRWRR